MSTTKPGSILPAFAILEYKEQHDGEHYSPIGMGQPKRDQLVDANNQKNNR